MKSKQWFSQVIASPYWHLFASVILAITSGHEIIQNLDKMAIGAHHGCFLWALFHILHALQEALPKIYSRRYKRNHHE